MDEIQVSNYMKLGLAKLSAGNLTEAENYFQEILKYCNYGPAWLGLGDATLAGLYREHNHENINQVVNNAFYFYSQSKMANPDEAEKIEVKILDTSLMYINRFCNDIKAQHDEKESIDKIFKRMLLPALIASTGGGDRSAAIGGHLQKLLTQGKSLENNIGYSIVAMTTLRAKAIASIESALDYRNEFIQATYNLENNMRNHLMAEKDKEAQQQQNSKTNQLGQENKKQQKGMILPMILVLLAIAFLLYLLLSTEN